MNFSTESATITVEVDGMDGAHLSFGNYPLQVAQEPKAQVWTATMTLRGYEGRIYIQKRVQ